MAGREGDGHHRRPLQAGMASSDGAGALDGAKNADLHPQPGGDDRPERGDNWNRKPDTGGGGPRAFGCGAQDGPPRLATAMGRRRRDEPGTSLPLRVCGKGVGHTSVRCRTYRLRHHARCVGLKAVDISRLARERGTWACRACPATLPAPPPAAPPGHLPTPTPQPQPPTARRDATPTAATGPRERRPAPPQVVTTGRLQARSA